VRANPSRCSGDGARSGLITDFFVDFFLWCVKCQFSWAFQQVAGVICFIYGI